MTITITNPTPNGALFTAFSLGTVVRSIDYPEQFYLCTVGQKGVLLNSGGICIDMITGFSKGFKAVEAKLVITV